MFWSLLVICVLRPNCKQYSLNFIYTKSPGRCFTQPLSCVFTLPLVHAVQQSGSYVTAFAAIPVLPPASLFSIL